MEEYLYEIKYHVNRRGCCRSGGSTASGTRRVLAYNEDDAKKRLREIIPGARFEKITRVEQ